MDPYKFLGISPNPNGTSLTRKDRIPLLPPSHSGEQVPIPNSQTSNNNNNVITVISKDIPLNSSPTHNTTLRLFLPSAPTDPNNNKLPLIIYFHGGGFVVFHAASAPFHAECAALAAAVPAAVASVEYRLAPEHRLPAAFDDAADAIKWARSAADVDVDRIFLMGGSAGATISLHAALDDDHQSREAVKLAGLILNQPYFGGKERTPSENGSMNDKIIPLPANDLLWELALPVGADRDHEYCNVATLFAKRMERVRKLPPCLVLGRRGDPLIDRQKVFVEMLEKAGVEVEARMDGDGCHGAEIFEPEKATELLVAVKDFVFRHGGGQDAAFVAVAREKL